MMSRKKDKKDKRANPVDVKFEPDEYSDKDVGFVSLFIPFMRNYATSLTKTHSPSKLPYPVCFYHPRSSLQHQMDLQMRHIDLLVEANMQPHPLIRFLNVVKYAIATCDLPKFPYKPIIAHLGETAHCQTQFSGSSDQNYTPTYFVGEQLVKDPPTCSFYIYNPSFGVSHTGSLALNPKFQQGHIRVHFDGLHKTTLKHPQGLYHEEYFIQIPDLVVRLLRMFQELEGEMTINCPVTGYSARINFKDKPLFAKSKNLVLGKISCRGSDLYLLDGAWDDVVSLTDINTGQKTEFFNRATIAKNRIQTPPLEELPETSGERIWGRLMEALHRQDFNAATEIKAQITQLEVQQAQESARLGIPFTPKYFHVNANREWEINDPSSYKLSAAQPLSE